MSSKKALTSVLAGIACLLMAVDASAGKPKGPGTGTGASRAAAVKREATKRAASKRPVRKTFRSGPGRAQSGAAHAPLDRDMRATITQWFRRQTGFDPTQTKVPAGFQESNMISGYGPTSAGKILWKPGSSTFYVAFGQGPSRSVYGPVDVSKSTDDSLRAAFTRKLGSLPRPAMWD
jgi:hypothetical protein